MTREFYRLRRAGLGHNYSGLYDSHCHLTGDHISELDCDGTVDQVVAEGAAVFIINDEDVAQRMMDKIEPDVRTHLVGVRVVLQECVQEHLGGKRVVEAGCDQVGQEMTLGQVDVVTDEANRG